MTQLSPSLQAGAPAPDFTLPAIHRDGQVSLSDYRGRNPVLLALFRGLYCPFCRRHIAALGLTGARLEKVGIQTLAVVATPVERARLYFRHRPTRLSLASDPDLTTFRAFQVPKPEPTPEFMEGLLAARTDLEGELPEKLPLVEAFSVVAEKDPYDLTATDAEDKEKQFPQLVGQFLLDRDGIIRWVNIEGATEGPSGMGKFPSDEEFLAAAARLEK
jgi:peroxiredoxin